MPKLLMERGVTMEWNGMDRPPRYIRSTYQTLIFASKTRSYVFDR